MRLTARHITKMNGVTHEYKYRVTEHENDGVFLLEVRLERIAGNYISESNSSYSDVEPEDVPKEVTGRFIDRLEKVVEDLRGHNAPKEEETVNDGRIDWGDCGGSE